jgi:sugar lactone lactonase YvrE
MNFLHVRPTALGLCLLASAAAGCSNTQGIGGQSALPASPVTAQNGTPAAVRSARPSTAANLYVANAHDSTVTVYAPGASTPMRTIGLLGLVDGPDALAFDAAGYLYVSNKGSSSVSIYGPGSVIPSRVISNGVTAPSAIAVDAIGNLFVANPASVTVYRAGTGALMQKITNGIQNPVALAFDGFGKLYVANEGPATGNVTVYERAGATSIMTLVKTITNDVNKPRALAFDPSGHDVFVANYGNGSVSTYSTASFLGGRVIRDRVVTPAALAFDGTGNLYVADGPALVDPGSVTEYSHGTYAFMKSIVSGVVMPAALAIDSSGYVDVANDPSTNSSITEYCPACSAPSLTISATTGHVSGPVALVYGP